MDNMLFSDSDSVNDRGDNQEEDWSDGCLTAKANQQQFIKEVCINQGDR
jgi:hypothetical protein